MGNCYNIIFVRLKLIDHIFFKGITPFLFACSLLTNITFCFLCCYMKKFNPILKTILVNLALADIIYLSTSMLESCWKSALDMDMLGLWKWSDMTEKVTRLAYGLLFMVKNSALYSMIFLLFVATLESFDRILVSKKNCASFMRTLIKAKNIYKFVIFLWFISFCMGGITIIPQMNTFEQCFYWRDEYGVKTSGIFVYIEMNRKTYITPRLFRALRPIQFWIVLVICIILCCKIYFRLAKREVDGSQGMESEIVEESDPKTSVHLTVSDASMQQSRSFQSYRQLQSTIAFLVTERYSHRIVYILVAAFFLLKAPSNFILSINLLWVTMWDELLIKDPYVLVGIVIIDMISSVVNPPLYLLIDSPIRSMLCKICCCRNETETECEERRVILSPPVAPPHEKNKHVSTSTFSSSTV